MPAHPGMVWIPGYSDKKGVYMSRAHQAANVGERACNFL